jgi:uncharacterized protein
MHPDYAMTEIHIVEIKDGIEFEVIAKPKSRASGIVGVFDGALRIAITAAPEKGKANDAIIKVLSEQLHIPMREISITTGQTSRHKRVRIHGANAGALLAILEGVKK